MSSGLMGHLARMFLLESTKQFYAKRLTDHPENDRISFHLNNLQRYSALSC